MSRNTELRRFLRELVGRGWTVEKRKHGHYALHNPRLKALIFAPGTPSDHRAFANLRAQIQRAERMEPTP